MTPSEVILSIATLIAGVVAGIATVANLRHKNSQERNKVAVDEYQVIVTRLEAQISRMERQIDEQQRSINSLYEAHALCQLEAEETYGWLVRMHDIARRQNDELRRLRRLAGDTEPSSELVPDLPPRRPRRDHPDPGFTQRTTAQNTVLVKDANSPTTNPTGAP